jgi:predicted NAD-dependent protein-ADP-ribosyltransferase YbiA (DUF1768 family)
MKNLFIKFLSWILNKIHPVMDIGSKHSYPASSLSNFAPHPFEVDGVKCASMEGFLQSLKFKSEEMQMHVCTLIGLAAKHKGSNKKWWKTQKLYWKGKEFDRLSEDYQELLDKAYLALNQNTKFRKALEATGNATLTHSIGKTDKTRTILTTAEFCSRLMNLRNYNRKNGII